jgi:predicted regulator of Ras-like GTPase activity (Roadblock/LC7/MglB family)
MTDNTKPDRKTERIRQVLRALIKSSPYIRAAAVVRLSGITVASVMPYYVEQERVSAMSAVMLLLGERINEAMRSGELGKVYIQGTQGHIVLMSIGGDAVLTLMASEEVPLGLVFLEMQLAIDKLKPLV